MRKYPRRKGSGKGSSFPSVSNRVFFFFSHHGKWSDTSRLLGTRVHGDLQFLISVCLIVQGKVLLTNGNFHRTLVKYYYCYYFTPLILSPQDSSLFLRNRFDGENLSKSSRDLLTNIAAGAVERRKKKNNHHHHHHHHNPVTKCRTHEAKNGTSWRPDR